MREPLRGIISDATQYPTHIIIIHYPPLEPVNSNGLQRFPQRSDLLLGFKRKEHGAECKVRFS